MKTIEVIHGTPEWHSLRLGGIGGSDAAAVIGKNPWKSNVELWEEKTGFCNPKSIANQRAAAFGSAAEEHLTALFALNYEDEYEVSVIKDKMFVGEKDFMFVDVDALLRRKSDEVLGVFECKTTEIMQSRQEEKWNEDMPVNYYCQCLHSLATIPEAQFVILDAYLRYKGKNGFWQYWNKTYMVNREDRHEDIQYLIVAEENFWRSFVVPKKRPPLILKTI